jgi:hypothetical protein
LPVNLFTLPSTYSHSYEIAEQNGSNKLQLHQIRQGYQSCDENDEQWFTKDNTPENWYHDQNND